MTRKGHLAAGSRGLEQAVLFLPVPQSSRESCAWHRPVPVADVGTGKGYQVMAEKAVVDVHAKVLSRLGATARGIF